MKNDESVLTRHEQALQLEKERGNAAFRSLVACVAGDAAYGNVVFPYSHTPLHAFRVLDYFITELVRQV